MATIGGPLAHQLPLHNYCSGLVQPSLVMNHHLDLDCQDDGHPILAANISKYNLITNYLIHSRNQKVKLSNKKNMTSSIKILSISLNLSANDLRHFQNIYIYMFNV